MKPNVFIDEDQLVNKAVKILVKELGAVEAGRFLSLHKRKRTESVKRHQKWQAQLDKDEFFERVFNKSNAQ